MAIAFWRTAAATSLLAVPMMVREREELTRLKPRDVLLLIGSAGFLALHFSVWITSIGLTTIASAALLVSATPIFTAVVSGMLGEKVPARSWLGIAIAILGGVLVAFSDVGRLSGAARGNLLALAGAAAAAGYLTIGRRLRSRLSVLTYSTSVYGLCAVMLLAASVVGGIRLTGFPKAGWLAIAGITLGPQLLGHTAFNFLLAHVDPTKITVGILGEPIFSALIAALLFGEVPGVLVLPGGILLLGGIRLVLLSGRRIDDAAPTG